MSEVIDLKKNIISIVANLCNLQFFANIFVRTVLTDQLTQFCWKLIYMYVIRGCMSEISILKKRIGNCKFMQHVSYL